MNIDTLNRLYGAPGRIVFRPGHAGYPNVVLANKYGTAEIALLGANVLGYRPTGHGPVIFRPAKRDYNRGDSFHGGIPVCWPQFGNRFSKALPQHGFARQLVFEVRGSTYSEEKTEIVLGLKSDDETKKLWAHDFDLTYTVSVTMKLNLELVTTNTGSEPFGFSCGFHPYFRLGARNEATVNGLKGLAYFNGVTGAPDEVQAEELKLDHDTDHIFTMPMDAAATRQDAASTISALKHEYAILDPRIRRAIALVSVGNDRTVVWNPGPEGKLADFESDDWTKFVCVEPVSDWPGGRTLAPGEKHILTAAIQAQLEER